MSGGTTIFIGYIEALGAVGLMAYGFGVPLAIAARRFDWAHDVLCKIYRVTG